MTAGLAAALSAMLAGCAGEQIRGAVVANHEAVIEYFAGASDELEALVTSGADVHLRTLDAYQAVDYHHFDAGDLGSVHVQYESYVDGQGYVCRMVTDESGRTFDLTHEAGSPYTYFLLGDQLQSASGGKPWVRTPIGDLDQFDTSGVTSNCGFYGINYLRTLSDAWLATKSELEGSGTGPGSGGELQVEVTRRADGSRQFATGVTYTSLADQNLLPPTDDPTFGRFLDRDAFATLIPLHLWVDPSGAITKAEVNGTLTAGDGEQFRMQIGFELLATTPSITVVPPSASQIPEQDVTAIDTEAALDEFLERLGEV